MRIQRKWRTLVAMFGVGLTCAASGIGVASGSTEAGAPPADASASESVAALLDDLEGMTETLVDFSARIVYERVDGLTEDAELRYGRVVYLRPPEARHRMAIILDELVDASGRKEPLDQRFVFTEGWVVDIDTLRRQFIKRQIAPPGSDRDPLRLGQGPFPLPIGQRRTDVESRFECSPAPPPAGRLAAGVDPDRLRSLRLVPRRGSTEADEFRSIDLYYDAETLLPTLVVATDPDGSLRTVRLLRPERNRGLEESDLLLLSAETPDPSAWTIDVRPWRSEMGAEP